MDRKRSAQAPLEASHFPFHPASDDDMGLLSDGDEDVEFIQDDGDLEELLAAASHAAAAPKKAVGSAAAGGKGAEDETGAATTEVGPAAQSSTVISKSNRSSSTAKGKKGASEEEEALWASSGKELDDGGIAFTAMLLHNVYYRIGDCALFPSVHKKEVGVGGRLCGWGSGSSG